MINIEGLTKVFQTKQEQVHAVHDIGFKVAAGEMVTLLGPSGCGKTTTLRCVAGLERPNAGRIQIGNRTVLDCESNVFVPAEKRKLGMVFQSYAIWPHMTVFQNVAYALEGQKLSRSEARRRTMETLELVQLEKFADRPAPRLSGGQQQRVAIARALVGNPDALLFDEPLSNLDAKLRIETRTELRRLQKQVGLTSIYVTHDQSEAVAISDWIIVMKDGEIVEYGRPADIYRYPRNIFTAEFIGTTNLIDGRMERVEPGTKLVAVQTELGRILGTNPGVSLHPGDPVQVSVRPEDLNTTNPPDGVPWNHLRGRVEFLTFTGPAVMAELRCGEPPNHCQIGRDWNPPSDAELVIGFSPDACVVLPRSHTEPAGPDGKEE